MEEEQERTVEVAHEPSTRSEWIKFGLIAVVLVGTVLVIGALRPLIFGQIVPAILGEGQPTAPIVPQRVEELPLKEELPAELDAAGETAPAADAEADPGETAEPAEAAEPSANTPADDSVEVFIPAVRDEAGGGAPAEADAPADEAAPAAESPADELPTHVVQPGETLTSIAQAYGLTVEAILAVNDIPNPNRIDAGTVLRIPQPEP